MIFQAIPSTCHVISTIFHQGAGFSNSSYWTQSASAHGATSSVSSMHGRSPRGVLCRRWSFKGLISARKHHWAKKSGELTHQQYTQYSQEHRCGNKFQEFKSQFKNNSKHTTKSALGAAKHEENIVLKKLLATGVCQIYMMSRLGCFLRNATIFGRILT